MMRRSSGALFSIWVLSVGLLTASIASAQSYKVEKITAPPPEEVAAAVREGLSGEALRVVGPQGSLCELWLRKAVPAKASATQDADITLGQLAEGTLVGVVRFAAEVKDFRRQKVKPGVYTLRYALVPTDGNHLGVAPQRDFLLASPAAMDQNLDTITREATLNLSRKTTGTNHPSVWSLMAVEAQPASLPAVAHREDGDLWLLQFRAPMQSGSAPSFVTMALVIVGYAPEA